jgi:hypothetical protein
MSRIEATIKPPGRVHVTIDRVVLRGVEPAARGTFVETLRTELATLLANPATRATLSVGSASQRTPVLRLGRVAMEPGSAGGRSLGVRVVRAIAGNGARPGGRSVRP